MTLRAFKDSLTFLAALLALGLIGLMVVPRLMDWNQQRARVAAHLSHVLGVEVALSGPLTVSIFPQASMTAERVRLGPADAPLLSAARLTISLSPLSLLGGALHIEAIAAEGADIALEPLFTRLSQPQSIGPRARGGIDRFEAKGARLTLPQRLGGGVLEALDLAFEAPSLPGPFRVVVSEMVSGREFRAQVGRFDGGRARLKGAFDDNGIGFRLALEGWVGLPGEAGGPLYDGTLQVNGNPVLGGVTGVQVPLEGRARVVASADQVTLDPITLTLGRDKAATLLTGQGFVDLLSPRPQLRFGFSTKWLDIAALLRGGDLPAPPAFHAGALPFDIALSFKAEGLALPGGTAQNLLIEGRNTVDGPVLDTAFALLPGETQLRFAARSGPRAVLDGTLTLESAAPASLIALLRGDAPPPNPPATKAQLSSAVFLTREALSLGVITLESEAGVMRGAGEWRFAKAGERLLPRLTLALNADRFDAKLLAALTPLSPLRGFELETTLDIASLLLDGRVLGGLSTALARNGEEVRLTHLRLRGKTGQDFTASGTLKSDGAELVAKLDADTLDEIAALAHAVSPGPAMLGVMRRAAVLAPALALLSFRLDMQGGDAQWDVALDGTLGGTRFDVKSRSSLKAGLMDVVLEGDFSNPDGRVLFAQITGQKPPVTLVQPGRLTLKASGNPRRMLEAEANGALAGLMLALKGQIGLLPSQRPFEGQLRLDAPDLARIEQAIGAPAPLFRAGTGANLAASLIYDQNKITLSGLEVKDKAGVAASGEIAFDLSRAGQVAGRIILGDIALSTLLLPVFGPLPAFTSGDVWPGAAFAAPLAPPFSGDLWVEAQRLLIAPGLVWQRPQFVVRFGPQQIGFEGFSAEDGEARYGGTLAFSRAGAKAEIAGKINVERLTLPGLSARISGDLPLSASGESLKALAASLGGAGQVAVDGLVLPDAAPQALPDLARAPLTALGPLDENSIGARLEAGLKAAPLALPALTFPVTITNGVLRLVAVPIPSPQPGVSLVPSLSYDLTRAALDARLTLRLQDSPPGWRGGLPEITLTYAGRWPEAANTPGLKRGLQVSTLVNGLLARSIERDLEQVEAFEADQRERLFFLKRQKAGERLEQFQ